MNETDEESSEVGIMDLPEEIVEYILSLVSPYSDFQSARLVCRLWYKIMKGVVQQTHHLFTQNTRDGAITWSSLEPEFGTMISERYSHSASYHNKAIYVFGGCTSTATTFNDLWRFDLTTRQWGRPLAIGKYPSPKACASLVSYKDILLLFGGWSHPTPLPLHQPNNFFNELHVYSPETNNWSQVAERPSRGGVPSSPPGRAGHAATVVGDKMVVFGGSRAHGTRCDDVWALDLENMEWECVPVQGTKPRPRFGHSQILLDSNNLLVIGGCAGPNMQFNDAWLLKMGPGDWCWREVKVMSPEHSPPKLWCHPACKVGEHVIVLSKLSSWSPRLAALESGELSPKSATSSTSSNKTVKSLHPDTSRKSKRPLPETSESSSQESSSDGEERSLNARKYFGSSYSASRMTAQLSASLRVNQGDEGAAPALSAPTGAAAAAGGSPAHPVPGPSRFSGANDAGSLHTLPVRDGMPSIRPNAMKNRQKQLEALRRHEERIRSKIHNPQPQALGGATFQSPPGAAAKRQHLPEPVPMSPQRAMFVHALDVRHAVTAQQVQWHPVGIDYQGAPPEEKIFYSLVHARGELIMFGGIKTDVNTMQRGVYGRGQSASNMTHIVKSTPKLR